MDYNLSENIQKNIAEYLPCKNISIKITIKQNCGCLHGTHHFDDCKNCKNCINIYNKSDIFIFLNSNHNNDEDCNKFFKEYISEIKKIIFDNNRKLKSDYSNWDEEYIKMEDLFIFKPLIFEVKNFNSIPNSFYNIFSKKIIIRGLKWLLFLSFLDEIKDIQNFEQQKIKIEQTVLSSSYTMDIKGNKKIKNNLRSINKIFNKYSYPNINIKKN